MARFGDLDTQYLDNAGDPLVNGKIYFYESGTTTLKTTYADVNSSIPNTNPVILTAAGRQPNIFFDGVAKAVLTSNSGEQILVRDPVGDTNTDFGDEWVATKVYSANDVVRGSDGVYYRSLSNGNQNNNPVTTSGSWTLLYSVEWNVGITYDIGAVVTYDNYQYQSLQAGNVGNQPDVATSFWVGLEFAWLSTAEYSEGQNAVGTDGVLYTSLQDSNTGNDPATSPAWWVGTSAAAAASAVAAAASATASASSATDSANSATASANSATASANSSTASASSATDSANSATASASSATDSANSATASASSAAASASSATDSANSASASASSASDSADSAAAALVSETAAAASEAASATSAAASASSATDSANSATASASSASDSATSAAASASSASDSATSASASAGSATASAGSATASAGSATAAAGSATAAAGSAAEAASSYDSFDDRYLGAKSSEPTVDNDGDALITGALYFDSTENEMRVYNGAEWNAAGTVVNGTADRVVYTATENQTTFAATYEVGFVDVYLNGLKLVAGVDFTATSGTDIVLSSGVPAGYIIDIVAYGAFVLSNFYSREYIDDNFATISTAQTLSNKTLSRTVFSEGYVEQVYVLSGDHLDPSNGTIQTKELTSATTFSADLSSGESILLMIENGNSHTVSWPPITWVTSTGNVAPTLTAKDTLVFWQIGSILYGAYVGGYA